MNTDNIKKGIDSIVNSSKDRDETLRSICLYLKANVTIFDWVGFYIVSDGENNMLELGPFAGKETEHVKIRFGEGICGQAAITHETFIVQDVSAENNYLSCSPYVQSEIVIPIFNDKGFVAELDIDSHTRNSITDVHRQLCEYTARRASKLFN